MALLGNLPPDMLCFACKMRVFGNKGKQRRMNIRQNSSRRRGRSNNRPQNGMRSGEQGSRIDNRARGNAVQLHEKYKNMARDVQLQGDRVMSEYYNQFADHYFRVLSEHRARQEEQQAQQRARYTQDDGGDDTGFASSENDTAHGSDQGYAANPDGDDSQYSDNDDYGASESRPRQDDQRRDGNRDTNRDANRDSSRDGNRRPNPYREPGRDSNRDAPRDTNRDMNRSTANRQDDNRDTADRPARDQARDAGREDNRRPIRERAPRRDARPARPKDDVIAHDGLDLAVLPPALTISEASVPETADVAPVRKPRARKPKADVATES